MFQELSENMVNDEARDVEMVNGATDQGLGGATDQVPNEIHLLEDQFVTASRDLETNVCYCQIRENSLLPSNQLLSGENKYSFRKEVLRIYRTALDGDWKCAEGIIKRDHRFLNSSLNEMQQTALHIAAGSKQTNMVKKLVDLITERGEELRLQDEKGNTALCHAAIAGSVPIVEILLKKDPKLALIRGGQNFTPLFIAIIFGSHEVARLLYTETRPHLQHLEPKHLEEIFFSCIETDMFDLAINLLDKFKDLAWARKDPPDQRTALHMLSQKPSAFASKGSFKDKTAAPLDLVSKLWDIILNERVFDPVKRTISLPFNLLFEAAKLGNYEFLAELIRFYPDLIWMTDGKYQTIFHIAVINRHVSIFNQIHSIGSIKDVILAFNIRDENSPSSDNILHLAAKLPSPHALNVVSGAALQMQRELLWFEEVKSVMQASDREKKGLNGMTPQKLFSEQHKELLEMGEKWMRDTAQSCIMAATLIITVTYSAGFTVPGGNNNNNGIPVQITHTLFHVFAVSEAVALSFAITSALMFLYILTSRYAEQDFLKSLPLKLLVGLATLYVSMIAMIVAFSSAFFLAYSKNHNLRCVPLVIASFLSIPMVLFVLLKYTLLRDIFCSTFFSRTLFRPKKSMFSLN